MTVLTLTVSSFVWICCFVDLKLLFYFVKEREFGGLDLRLTRECGIGLKAKSRYLVILAS